ncbi:hypothetical protein GCM10028796_11460 [Ramlibacter monticola]|uniref:DUF3016 domain-containing protein n=1 Tax=Ramlibacter monticola TaxID=1926872 RepID=A0A936YWR1_9BURK|nr:DUF3016 domain-containing protein [Ramlibacter monticola]MBL0389999.1 DUF3016 domain-containing protein [Ramlibacter monticola]
MHKRSILWGGSLFAMAAAAADVSVVFVQPEKYTDSAYSRSFASPRDRAEVERDIEQHLQRLGARFLPEGDSLRVEVLDVDLAGHFEPLRFHSGSEVRIVRDITWPRIQLRYTLTRGDQMVGSGEERLSDMNFLSTPNRYSPDDRLRYEKAMLDNWFESRFGRRR